MSSRYPSNDSRYTSRDRTPPRYADRRSSTTYGGSSFVPRNDEPSNSRPYPDSVSGSASRDVPRGPKALSDSTRGPPPGGGAPVPAGPRGRGFGGRSEYRELRDAPPLSDGRGGSSWRGGDRDRHFDRRDRPLSPRARSPGRDSRDSRDSRDFGPRELDIDRARRSARDGPPSAGSNYSDPPSSAFGFHGRGGFSGRGRGRGDWDNRGRGRGSFADDRNSFRPRSRSPRPRWDKESSRDDRLSDRRDDRRFDRRDDDRPFYRDDRDVDRYKRDPVSSRDADIRRASVAHDGRYSSAASSTSHQSPRHPSISSHSGLDRASTADLPRELLPGRRTSVAQEPGSAKDKPDYIAARAEASRDRYGPRASSPPPQAPQVPAFGSVSSFQKPATTFTTPTSNVWRPPQPTQPATPASAAPPGPKIPPSAPKALSAVPPTAPTGPKATRVAEKPPVDKPVPDVQQPVSSAAEQPKPKLENGPSAPSYGAPVPTAPSAESNDANPTRSRPPSPPIAPPTGPAALQSRPPAPTPPTGPRGLVSPQQPHNRLIPPPPVPPRDGPPAANIPLGPRAAGPFSTSPRGPNAGLNSGPAIPTGPKADRAPPVAPRAALFPQAERAPMNAPRPPMMGIPGRNLQWIRPDAPRYPRGPGPVVPAKRDSEGDEKERYASNRPRSPAFAVGSPVSGPATPTPATHDPVAMRRKSAGEIRSRDDAPETFSARRNSAFAVSDSNIKTERPSITPQPTEPQARESQSDEASEDDDEMDLDDEFFSQSQTRYEREKSLLEARLKNLEDQRFRCSNPFKVLMRLSRISESDLPQPETAPEPDTTATIEKPQAAQEPDRMEEDVRSPTEFTNGLVPELLKEKEKLSPVTMEHEAKIEPPKLPTPKAEESEDVEMGEAGGVEEIDAEVGEDSSEDESITEADLHSLPYLNRGPPTPLSDPDQESIGLKTNIMAAIKDKLFNTLRAEQEFQGSALNVFRMQYRHWGLEAAQREKEVALREEKEKTEEQETAVSPSETAAQVGPAHRQRHVTDYDLENILAESRRMEEERIEKQRREEEASKNPFSNGQAPIPDMLPEEELQRRQFVNTNRLREPGKGILTFGFEPPEDDFTPEEHKALVSAYLQSPKDWGEIAKALPGRTFRECINHYYATKWNGEYKPPTGRRKAKRRAGIPKGRKTAIPFASTDQVEGEDGTVATTTERGRPRRAAAPTFGDKEVQDDQATPAPTPGRQRGASTRGETVEPSTEKPVKRQRVAKEKGTKRGRAAQQLAPAPSASPQKMDKDFYQADGSLDLTKVPRTEEEAALLARHASVQPEVAGQFAESAFQMPQPAPVPERPKGRGASSRAGGMSSYWSVNESTDFRNYLGYYGTDFQAIAKQMGTKTAAMVKNEYVRKTDSGSHPELAEIAHAADERRRRGEDIGPPPPPTVSTKRRYDTTQPAIPRTLAPTPAEIVDVKQSPPAADLPARTASPHVQAGSRFPPLAQASPALSASTPPTSVIASTSVPAPSSHAPAYGKPLQHEMPGPRRGFFSQREPTRAALVQPEVRQPPEPPRDVHADHHPHRRQFSQGLPGPQQMQDPRFPRLQTEQRDRDVPAVQQPDMFGSSTAAHQALYRTSVPPQPPSQRGSEPPTPSSTEARPGQIQQATFSRVPPPLRHLTETPSQLPVAQPSGRVPSRPVSPKREEIQQPYVAPPPPVQATPRTAPVEPRKTSNLADLLNPAPSEPPKPKEQKPPVDDRSSVAPHERPYSAQGRPVHQTTAPPPQAVTMSSSSPAYPPRRELYAESPAPNSPFARQAYLQQQQQQQQMQAPPQRRPLEVPAREQSQPPPSRDPWARPAYSQPPPPSVSQTSSPHPSAIQQPQAPLPMDGRQQFSSNHRAALSQLNTQAQPRNVHSPTPSHTPHHSRTPSYTHPQPSRQQAPTPLQPLPAAPSPARGEVPGPVLAANPYAQMTPPQSIQQLVPQAQVQQQAQRNEQAAIQNRTLSYSQPQNQAYENMIERERAIRLAEQRDRDDQIMREREAQAQAQAQVQAAHHHSRSASFAQPHYLRQPTPSQADHAASRFSSAGPGAVPPPPSRNTHTPTGHMGYPPPPAPPTHHGIPTSQEHPHAHSFAGQVPSAAQRGLEAIMRRDQESAIRRQQEAAAVQHQQAQAQAHAHAQAHREHRYREEVAAAQQREEQIRRHEEIMVRDRIDRDRAERDRMDREYIERDRVDRQRRERDEWERQQARNIFGGARDQNGLFGPNRR